MEVGTLQENKKEWRELCKTVHFLSGTKFKPNLFISFSWSRERKENLTILFPVLRPGRVGSIPLKISHYRNKTISANLAPVGSLLLQHGLVVGRGLLLPGLEEEPELVGSVLSCTDDQIAPGIQSNDFLSLLLRLSRVSKEEGGLP